MRKSQLAVVLSQWINVVLAGYAGEMLSSRAWRMRNEKKRWAWACRFIDSLFSVPNHCENAYRYTLLKQHMPPEMRDLSASREQVKAAIQAAQDAIIDRLRRQGHL